MAYCPSGPKLCYMAVGLLMGTVFLLFLVWSPDRMFLRPMITDEPSFEGQVPNLVPGERVPARNYDTHETNAPYLVVDERVPTRKEPSVYESELISILDRAQKEESHSILKVNSDVECSERNFTDSYSKCFKDGHVICGKRYLPVNPKERIKDFTNNENIRIAPQYQQALKEMASQVVGQYDIIIVSALSSNHYVESQAMLRELHQKIFPLLSSYLLVVYDIGLTKKENLEYQKYCRCKLIKFPFHKFPDFVKKLKCFGWKPVVTRAHFDNAKLVMWMDASARYQDPNGFIRAMEWTQTYGAMQHRVDRFVPNPLRVIPTAFQFFGDSPCAHLPFTQAESNWGVYRTTPLFKDIVMDSWVACGLNTSCTCPNRKVTCSPSHKGIYGECMRPQFAIAAILSKLYLEHYDVILAKGGSFVQIRRGNKFQYFQEIVSPTTK